MLCGTREDVAARATQYRDVGMDLPLLQPVVQDDEQMKRSSRLPRFMAHSPYRRSHGEDAAYVLGAGANACAREAVPAGGLADDRTLTIWSEDMAARTGMVRDSTTLQHHCLNSACRGCGALAAFDGLFDWRLFVIAFLGAIFLHIGTNVINEIYDVSRGVDTITRRKPASPS